MSDKAKRIQVAQQCEAVAHLATTLAGVHRDYAMLFREERAATLIDMVGERTAYLMETLGNILNGMDAVDEQEDAWLGPVFAEAHRLWPQPKEST